MNTFTIGCITNYGMGVHKPKSIRIAVSDDNKSYRDVTGLNYTPEEIFREGTYIEDLSYGYERNGGKVYSCNGEWSGGMSCRPCSSGTGIESIF